LAINKRKVLEAARKYAQKGAQAKALKEFERLLKLDPRDARLRLEIGDTHRRWGNVEKAVDTYSKVADQYMKEGFDARAVAVYKQIHNLDPEAYETYEPLAELYQRMGLTAEAILALQTAADGYHKQGKKREALDLLRKMATLDPTNTTSRIKVADLLRQEQLDAEAVAEYEEVTAELERQGDREGATSVYERILEIEPDRIETVIKLAEVLIEGREADRAEPFAKRALEAGPDEPARYELLASVYRLQQRDEELVDTYRKLSELYRQRGEEDRAREILQRYVPTTNEFEEDLGIDDDTAFAGMGSEVDLGASGTFSSPEDSDTDLSLDESETFSTPLDNGAATPLDDLAEATRFDAMVLDGEMPSLRDGDIPSKDGRDDAHRSLDGGDGGEIPLEFDSAVGEPDVPREVAPEAVLPPPPIADPEQLLAEASVYLRYGKRDQAIANLEAIVAQDSGHRAALEKLGEAYADADQGPKAVETWMCAADCARHAGDAEGVAVLRDRIAALDEAAAASLDASGADAQDDGTAEMPVPPSLSPAEGEATVLDLSAIESDLSGAGEARQIDLDDIEIDIEGSEFADEIPSDDGDTAEDHIGLADDATSEDALTDESGADTSDVAGPGSSSSMAQQVTEDLEEADFYTKQGLVDEAEVIYKRVLSIAPNHPHALVRLGELAATRGEDPGSTGAGPASPEGAETTPELSEPDGAAVGDGEEDSAVWSDDIAGPDDLDLASPAVGAEEAAQEPEEAVTSVRSETALEDDLARQFLAEVSGSDDIAPHEDAGAPPGLEPDAALEPDIAPGPDVAPEPHSGAEAPGEPEPGSEVHFTDPDDSFASPAVDMGEPPDLVAGSAGSEEQERGFDLAAELNDALDDDTNAGTMSGLGDSNDGFEAVFSAFKKGVSQTLSESDHEAHFDLGIAYREMGLFEDAKGEFRAAMLHPQREIECRHMLGLCCFEQEQFEDAIGEFEQIARLSSANDEQRLTAQFELGRAWEALGERENARGAYEAVAAVDPAFCEVEARLAALEEPEKPEEDARGFAAEGEGFECFEDLISEGDAGVEVSEAEVDAKPETAEYESFDDFLADDEEDDAKWADGEAVEVSAEAEPEPAPEPIPEPPPAPEVGDAAAPELVPEPAPEPIPEPPPAPEVGDAAAPEPPRRKKRKKISFV
jgi:tetratricopeptide (TPR) repeat protein